MKTIIQKLGMMVALLLSFLPCSAYDFEADGIYYNIVSLDELTCKVTYGDNKYVGAITIPAEVTLKGRTLSVISIGNIAFYHCTGLTSINIPNSVTTIGESAFYGCSGLNSLVIPNSVTEIGSYAFWDCTSLTSINIPNSVTKIGSNAFQDCTSLTSINIPNSVTVIGGGAFYHCTGLTSINIPNSVTEIGIRVFYGCSGLTSVTIPNSVTTIGEDAFYRCSGLTSVTIPNSVTKIGVSAFFGCSGLTSVTIPNSVTTIGESAFSGCTGLVSLEIPASLKLINSGSSDASFGGCLNIKKLVILGEDNISELTIHIDYDGNEFHPFSQLRLEELYLGRVVEQTDNDAFPLYPSLNTIKKITFGKYLKEIGTGFYCRIYEIPTTAEIYCENPTPPIGGGRFTNQQYISNVVYVPKEALDAYKQADGWKNFWDIKPYDFDAGIEDVTVDNTFTGIYKVYNLAGILVKETADKADAFDLPAGIYIINGRKVAIR